MFMFSEVTVITSEVRLFLSIQQRNLLLHQVWFPKRWTVTSSICLHTCHASYFLCLLFFLAGPLLIKRYNFFLFWLWVTLKMSYWSHNHLVHFLSLMLPTQAISQQDLVHMAIQISCGMSYLARREVIHKDLAARNCV